MNSSSNVSRKETERTKLIQEKCQTLLTQMLRDEDNKYCVDCDAKGPRWASWNLGVFLCIRCAGIHRNLGVHISRVKSVNLDTWTPEQVISLQQMGNSRARAVYEAQLPDGFRRPQTDTALESFIRAKYEHKKYLAREWVPPSPPKVDWAKEIDDELERQKRKKKTSQMNSVLGIGNLNVSEKKTTANAIGKSAPLPAPLPKPKSNQSHEGSSPKTHRTHISSTSESNQTNNDLLGLSSPTKPIAAQNTTQTNTDLVNDSFSNFLSAAPVAPQAATTPKTIENTLAQEEEDFFNQGSAMSGEKDKSGKLTKDSILALYATSSTSNSMFSIQPQPMFGMAPAYMGATSGGMPPQAQQQHQFMTPPNSTSMYNAPVMTAPTAFSTTAMGGLAVNNAFGTAQFGYAPPQQQSPLMGMGLGGGIMATGQAMPAPSVNLMQSNQQNLLTGVNMMAPTPLMNANIGGLMGGLGMPMNNTMSPFQNTATSTANSGNTAALNQQFGNLNIGNVWQ